MDDVRRDDLSRKAWDYACGKYGCLWYGRPYKIERCSQDDHIVYVVDQTEEPEGCSDAARKSIEPVEQTRFGHVPR